MDGRIEIGKVIEATTTTEFKFILNEDVECEKLAFSYVEIDMPNGEKLIGRILDIKKENPLLTTAQAGVAVRELVENLTLTIPSKRFTYGIAECEVVGILTESSKLEPNRMAIQPGEPIHSFSDESLRKLFYKSRPNYLPVGYIDSFGATQTTPITLDGDELVTKHFAIFGMTGSGKTNTAAKIIEELMIRGYRVIIFDPHDDYQNLDDFSEILEEYDKNMGIKYFTKGLKINDEDIIPLLRALSIIYHNKPIWEIIKDLNGNLKSTEILEKLDQAKFDEIKNTKFFRKSFVKSYNIFPEIRYYGRGFEDFTISLLEGFLNEMFTEAQRRHLWRIVSQSSNSGSQYLKDLLYEINNQDIHPSTKDALLSKLSTIINIYEKLERIGILPKDIETLSHEICLKSRNITENVHRFSLSTLRNNIRKTLFFSLVNYIFRSYKFGNMDPSDRYPILFILEEARTLIPARSTIETDYSSWFSVRAMRDLAYEGRKYKIGYCLISQKPSTIDAEVSSQCNSLILHQLKSPDDQDYVKKVAEGLTKVEIDKLKNIGTGKAVITGTCIRSTILVNIFRRYSKEGVTKPTPLSDIVLEQVNKIREKLRL